MPTHRRTLGPAGNPYAILTTWENNGRRAALLETNPDNLEAEADGPDGYQRQALEHLKSERGWDYGSFRFFKDYRSHLEEMPVMAHPETGAPAMGGQQAWVSEQEVQQEILLIEQGITSPDAALRETAQAHENLTPQDSTETSALDVPSWLELGPA